MSELPPNILDCIGNTSMLALRNIVPENGSRILLKLETENPTSMRPTTSPTATRRSPSIMTKRHSVDRIRAIALMETLVGPASWKDLGFVQRFTFRRLRHPVKGRRMIAEKDFFVEKMLPMMTDQKLGKDVMDACGTARSPTPPATRERD